MIRVSRYACIRPIDTPMRRSRRRLQGAGVDRSSAAQQVRVMQLGPMSTRSLTSLAIAPIGVQAC